MKPIVVFSRRREIDGLHRDLAKVSKERDTFERIARNQEVEAGRLAQELAKLKTTVGRGGQVDYFLETIERTARELRALGLGR